MSIKTTKNIPKPTNFGKNLKFLRRLNGLSQTDLASQVNMSRNNIASYESGLVEPNTSRFLSVCNFFDIKPKEMLEKILSEQPSAVISDDPDSKADVRSNINDQIESFITETNEITKVLDGYKEYYNMRRETEDYEKNKGLYSTLDDLLNMLDALVKSNWSLIQSVYQEQVSSTEE